MNQIIRDILQYTGKRYSQQEYPVLRHQYLTWQNTGLLNGKCLLDATPLYTNTLLKYVPLIAAGAKLTVAVCDKNPFDETLVPFLESIGIQVICNAQEGEYDCIMDCSGAHAKFRTKYGVAELTRSGYYQYVNSGKPVILVDSGRIKTIETCLGTGDGFLRGMAKLGFERSDFQGKSVVVFGCGKVGRGVAMYSQLAGAKVTFVDESGIIPPPGTELVDRHDKTALQKLLRDAWCVVTATGIRGAMNGNGAAEVLRSGTQLVAAMGIEDEWLDELPESRQLCAGKPVNFILDEPTRLRYIDPTMALSNLAAVELMQKSYPAGINQVPEKLEKCCWEIVEQSGLIAGEVSRLGL